jgi:DNA polymerase kappa
MQRRCGAVASVLAQISSDVNKPNGQHCLPADRGALAAFLEPLPLRRLPGIGRVAERLLREGLGATTCAELLERRGELLLLFSAREANSYLTSCLGIGGEAPPPAQREGEPAQKGVSQERACIDLPMTSL